VHAGDVREEVLVSHERPEERFAFAVVARVLAATVEPYDIRGRQGAIDAILHYRMVELLHSKSHPSGRRTKPPSSTISAPRGIARASPE
jgi:hypothetical protein